MATSHLLDRVRQIEGAIDRACVQGKGQHKRRVALRRELIDVLLLREQPARLLSLGLPWKQIEKELDERFSRLSAAIDILARYGLAKNRAAKDAGIPDR